MAVALVEVAPISDLVVLVVVETLPSFLTVVVSLEVILVPELTFEPLLANVLVDDELVLVEVVFVVVELMIITVVMFTV